MDKHTSKLIKESIRKVEKSLISQNYAQTISIVDKSRLSAQDIENEIKNYSGNITPAPEDVFDKLDIINVGDPNLNIYHIDFDLWVEGKKSDLTLSLEINLSQNFPIISIEDLHVL